MIGNVCTVALKSLNCPVSSIPCAASAYFDSPERVKVPIRDFASSECCVRNFVSLLQYESDGCVRGLV